MRLISLLLTLILTVSCAHTNHHLKYFDIHLDEFGSRSKNTAQRFYAWVGAYEKLLILQKYPEKIPPEKIAELGKEFEVETQKFADDLKEKAQKFLAKGQTASAAGHTAVWRVVARAPEAAFEQAYNDDKEPLLKHLARYTVANVPLMYVTRKGMDPVYDLGPLASRANLRVKDYKALEVILEAEKKELLHFNVEEMSGKVGEIVEEYEIKSGDKLKDSSLQALNERYAKLGNKQTCTGGPESYYTTQASNEKLHGQNVRVVREYKHTYENKPRECKLEGAYLVEANAIRAEMARREKEGPEMGKQVSNVYNQYVSLTGKDINESETLKIGISQHSFTSTAEIKPDFRYLMSYQKTWIEKVFLKHAALNTTDYYKWNEEQWWTYYSRRLQSTGPDSFQFYANPDENRPYFDYGYNRCCTPNVGG